LEQNNIKVAIIDLYNGEKNEGMRCIQDIIKEIDAKYNEFKVVFDIYDTRLKVEIPDNSYDIYISSGGPGDPFDGEGKEWERKYFALLDTLWAHNQNDNPEKKYLFFICHSYQIMVRYFKLGIVNRRNSKSFGIMPVHHTDAGFNDPIIKLLPEPFYAADFREFQTVLPNTARLKEIGAKVLCLEKIRPDVDYERAMMAIRISDEIMGTQFHPEADHQSMDYHFRQPERREHVVSKYGEKKYFEMLELLDDPMAVPFTRKIVLPEFLSIAVDKLRPEYSKC